MRNLFNLLTAVLITTSAFAQTPENVGYQTIIRDAKGVLVTDQDISITISILQGSDEYESGTEVYRETHTTRTNSNGLVSLEIGSGACDSGQGSGYFSMIDWGKNGPYLIKTETNIAGKTITASTALLSVPYALYAKVTETVNGFEVLTNVPKEAVFTDDQKAADVNIDAITNLGSSSNVQEALEALDEAIVNAGDMKKEDYGSDGIIYQADNAATVNSNTVLTAVPENAVFTDNQKADQVNLSTPINIGDNEVTTVEDFITRFLSELRKLQVQLGSQ